jgi:RimJ/RimL family protein N-acetyltransferase
MLYLGTFSTNSNANILFRKVGFRETGSKPKKFYRNDKYIDDIIMSLEL